MKHPHENENESDSICKLNKNLSQSLPTTSITVKTNVDHKHLITKSKTLDYPLCCSLLNDHLLHADFYSGLGPYTINTEWLV